jgi:hypothetical protein
MAAVFDPEINDSTVFWLVRMEACRLAGQFLHAEEARKELERLGIRVVYGGTPTATPVAQGAEATKGGQL